MPRMTKVRLELRLYPLEDTADSNYSGNPIMVEMTLNEEQLGNQDRRLVEIVGEHLPELLRKFGEFIEFGRIVHLNFNEDE